MELILRLHRHLHEQDEERRRWQRGLGESLWRHRRLIGNPRYGPIGLVALPFLLLEFPGAIVEVAGLPGALAAFALGELSAAYTFAFLVVSVLFGMLLSVAALTLEEFSFRRDLRGREAARVLWYAELENFGYRQLVSLWRALAFVDLARGKKDWGVQRRRGINGSVAPHEPRDEDPRLKPTCRTSDTQLAPASSLRRLPELPDRASPPGSAHP